MAEGFRIHEVWCVASAARRERERVALAAGRVGFGPGRISELPPIPVAVVDSGQWLPFLLLYWPTYSKLLPTRKPDGFLLFQDE